MFYKNQNMYMFLALLSRVVFWEVVESKYAWQILARVKPCTHKSGSLLLERNPQVWRSNWDLLSSVAINYAVRLCPSPQCSVWIKFVLSYLRGTFNLYVYLGMKIWSVTTTPHPHAPWEPFKRKLMGCTFPWSYLLCCKTWSLSFWKLFYIQG